MQEELSRLAERADKLADELTQLHRDAVLLSMRVAAPLTADVTALALRKWAEGLRGGGQQ
jgi:hypothetical protein